MILSEEHIQLINRSCNSLGIVFSSYHADNIATDILNTFKTYKNDITVACYWNNINGIISRKYIEPDILKSESILIIGDSRKLLKSNLTNLMSQSDVSFCSSIFMINNLNNMELYKLSLEFPVYILNKILFIPTDIKITFKDIDQTKNITPDLIKNRRTVYEW